MLTSAAALPNMPFWRKAMKWMLVAASSLLILLLTLSSAFAFTPPRLDGHVVDTANKLSSSDLRYLDQRLDQIRQQTGFEIVAFVVGSLEGETIEDVAYTTFNTWEIGRKDLDNGVLLVISPADRRVRIETGKGVGGALTDLQSNDIIRETIAPLLRQERFGDAIEQGSVAIARTLTQGTEGKSEPGARAPQFKLPPLYKIAIFGGIGVLVLFLAIVSRTFRSILWTVLQVLFFFMLRGGGGGGGGGSGYSGGGGRSGGGGSSGGY